MSTDPINTHPELVHDRYTNRRKMAWISFRLFSGVGIAMIVVGMFYPAVITGIWMQAAFVMGLWASVVAAYFGVTYGVDRAEVKAGK